MPGTLASLNDSILVVVDIQPSFLNAIHRKDTVLHRAKFLVEAATVLGVPIVATEQYPERMKGTEESLAELLAVARAPVFGKMSFSCSGCSSFVEELQRSGKEQVVLVGIETHICVNQTAHHLLGSGKTVFLAADAISARTEEMHSIAMRRMVHAGAIPTHTESLVYEWMNTAEHPRFRDVLSIVKKYS